ncbi:MAG: hypothetical protein SO023_04225 [Eubacterium sp.]|nr:hypothetical protein [Eubacterium sp.]
MTLLEFIKDRRRKAILFFLAGLFSGGILYFLCKEAAKDSYEYLTENVMIWMREEQDTLSVFLYQLCNRGKVALVMFLAGCTKWRQWIFRGFLVWQGAKTGFLLFFLWMSMGARGILCWMAMGFPQIFLLVPAYVIFFYGCLERKRKFTKVITGFFFFAILLSCVAEAVFGQKMIQLLQTFTFW